MTLSLQKVDRLLNGGTEAGNSEEGSLCWDWTVLYVCEFTCVHDHVEARGQPMCHG